MLSTPFPLLKIKLNKPLYWGRMRNSSTRCDPRLLLEGIPEEQVEGAKDAVPEAEPVNSP